MAIKVPLYQDYQQILSTPLHLSAELVEMAVERAGRRLAPLWSLRNFVAVNPYLGFVDQTFETTAQKLARRAGARLTAPRLFYAEAIQRGQITDADLEAAIADGKAIQGAPHNADALKAFAMDDQEETAWTTLMTVTDVAGQLMGQDWSGFVTESISRWSASYFDLGQSYWQSPWGDLTPYSAWRAEAKIDRSPEVRGIRGFRHMVADLPASSLDTITFILEQLDIPIDGLDTYLHRLLLTIHGWASYGRYLLWEAELREETDTTLMDLLAIRLVWEWGIYKAFAGEQIEQAWETQKHTFLADDLKLAEQRMLAGELLLQQAFEKSHQRELIGKLSQSKSSKSTGRKQVQAAFCIDVRSEVFRRAFESTGESVETIGFAGFFGFPIEYVRLGDSKGGAQCPALITPQFVITESVADVDEEQLDRIRTKRMIKQRATKAWRSFKMGAVSCFGFVGPVGLAYLKNLIMDTFGMGRPVPNPATFGLDKDIVERLTPRIEEGIVSGRITGMSVAQRLDVAEGMLKAMSLTSDFARVVMLVGHGATTVNNPYATGLDCGACGGHSGEANARVAAQVLNDVMVRKGLMECGIVIPEDTIFVAALHDTTTDNITVFDSHAIPSSHQEDMESIKEKLATASHLARLERATLLRLDDEVDIDKAIFKRSKDWSQVRPEWGLAGCSAFIIAPREHTSDIDLGGRSFLHSYDWQQDQGFKVLEQIMTAPMIVTSWINLQYFASAVDNKFFGSGNKVLHNVVGTLGILEGNGGDLRVGLPWQSVHDGDRYIHEPLRLSVMVEAPIGAINDIIMKHDTVRQLVDHGWLHLFAMDDAGCVSHRYVHDLDWSPVTSDSL